MDINGVCQGIDEVSSADDRCVSTIAFSVSAEDVGIYVGTKPSSGRTAMIKKS